MVAFTSSICCTGKELSKMSIPISNIIFMGLL